jgi:hypothetical protein
MGNLQSGNPMPASPPRLLPMAKKSEAFAGVSNRLDGELVPVLTVEGSSDQPVFFEHHILLWKHPSVEIRLRPMKGALKRIIAGMQVFVTEAVGTGQIAFSRRGPARCPLPKIPRPLDGGGPGWG